MELQTKKIKPRLVKEVVCHVGLAPHPGHGQHEPSLQKGEAQHREAHSAGEHPQAACARQEVASSKPEVGPKSSLRESAQEEAQRPRASAKSSRSKPKANPSATGNESSDRLTLTEQVLKLYIAKHGDAPTMPGQLVAFGSHNGMPVSFIDARELLVRLPQTGKLVLF